MMGYIDENTKGRVRLEALVGRLSDKDLDLPVGDGWTIAGLLAHLAFWDFRVIELLERWKKEGVRRSPIDIDNVNAAMKPLCLAIPGREAAKLALIAAEKVDAELENLPQDIRPRIDTFVQEGRFRKNRSLHRNEHLDQIDGLIGSSGRDGTGTSCQCQ